jgi:hypothetical protein
VKDLRRRIVRIEARQQRKGLEPYTVTSEDGKVSARITPLKGRPPAVTVWYDPARYEAEEALEVIGPRLPPDANVFVFPETLTPEEWESRYTTKLREEPPTATTIH